MVVDAASCAGGECSCARSQASSGCVLEAEPRLSAACSRHARGLTCGFAASRGRVPRLAAHGRPARPRPPGRLPGRAREHARGVRGGAARSAPTASSSTCTAAPTACWWSTTTPPSPGVGVLAEPTARRDPGALPTSRRSTRRSTPAPGMLVNVEVKNLPGRRRLRPGRARRRGRGRAPRTTAARRDDVLVSSFNLATIDRVRALDADVPTGFLTCVGFDPLEGVGDRAAHGATARSIPTCGRSPGDGRGGGGRPGARASGGGERVDGRTTPTRSAGSPPPASTASSPTSPTSPAQALAA